MNLLARNLRYYAKTNAAVAFGVAIATAVVVGSLVVADSVKGSLRDSALSRLGNIQSALVAPIFFDAARAATDQAPLILTTGVVANDDTGATIPNVHVVAVDNRFAQFWPNGFQTPANGEIALDPTLAKELAAKPDSALILTVPKPGVAPNDSLFAHRKRSDLAAVLRATSVRILASKGAAEFGLDASTTPRRNVFVSREWLAEALGKNGKANTLIAAEADPNPNWRQGFQLEDAGLKLVDHGKTCDLQTDHLVLTDDVVDASKSSGIKGERISMALATRIKAGEREAAYAVVGAREGSPTRGIAIGKWLAEDLRVKANDRIQVEFLSPRPDGTYATIQRSYEINQIDPDSAADPTLVPTVQGLTDAKTIADWNPPFPVDLSRIKPRDEQYWKRYRAAPKAFVSLSEMQKLWGDKGDFVTSYRFQSAASEVQPKLLKRLDPAKLGLAFRPVRKLALAAAEGSTEYASLFMGLGLFIVVSAAGLAATLMRLAVARRSAQWGLMLSCGLTPRRVAGIAQTENAVVSAAGAIAGAFLGVAYAAAMIAALTRWWIGAIGTAPLWLHLQWPSVAAGAAAGWIVGFAAVAIGIRAALKATTKSLLAGPQSGAAFTEKIPAWKKLAFAASILLTAASLVATLAKAAAAEEAFWGAGAGILLAALFACDFRLSRPPRKTTLSLKTVAARNAAINRRHSLLVVALLACACFTLVAVAPNAQTVTSESTARSDSGSGGFSFVATVDVPLPADFGSPAGRKTLGFTEEDEAAFKGVEIVPLLRRPGENTSCQNLAKPTNPSVVAVSPQLIARGGFTLRTLTDSGWQALRNASKTDAINAFGDSETTAWILHSGLGGEYTFPGAGKPLKVRFQGLVEKSLFAGDILISEPDFRRLYPTDDAPRLFLIAAQPGKEAQVEEALRRNLGELGLEFHSTREILAGFLGVQNAYISTFLALGALGLLLGTVGLAAALARNAYDRRREFALMLATGFTRRQIARMLAGEHLALLAYGVAAGTVSAVVAGAPLALSKSTQANWPFVAAVIAGVLVAGWAFCAAAARLATCGNLISSLRSE